MPNVTITPDEETCIIKTQSFSKTIDDVANMSDIDVSDAILKAGKGTQFLVGPLADMDKARDTLMDLRLASLPEA